MVSEDLKYTQMSVDQIFNSLKCSFIELYGKKSTYCMNYSFIHAGLFLGLVWNLEFNFSEADAG